MQYLRSCRIYCQGYYQLNPRKACFCQVEKTGMHQSKGIALVWCKPEGTGYSPDCPRTPGEPRNHKQSKKKVMKQKQQLLDGNSEFQPYSFSVCHILSSLRAVSGIDFLWLFTVLLDHLSKVKTPQNSPFLSSQFLLGDLAQQFLGKEVLILHEKAHRRPWGFREALQATTCETEVDFLFTSHPWSPFFNPSQGSSVKEQRKSIN